jgi:diaminopimelate decarboxylase
MENFPYRDGSLYAENVPVSDIAATHGTPCYIYSRAALELAFGEYQHALEGCEHLICYAVKANSNLAVLNVLARLGAGFDIVSGGELERVIAAGGDPVKIVFSGVGKKPGEMARALELGIHCFNLESAAELEVLNRVAGDLGLVAPISVRVNPDVDAKTHPYISTGLRENKFGVTADEALRVYQRAAQLSHVQVVGMDCHIGSQLTEISQSVCRRPAPPAGTDRYPGRTRHSHQAPGPGRRPGCALPGRTATLHRRIHRDYQTRTGWTRHKAVV